MMDKKSRSGSVCGLVVDKIMLLEICDGIDPKLAVSI